MTTIREAAIDELRGTKDGLPTTMLVDRIDARDDVNVNRSSIYNCLSHTVAHDRRVRVVSHPTENHYQPTPLIGDGRADDDGDGDELPNGRPLREAVRSPRTPDGSAYRFDCCAAPDVWAYADETRRCRVCGMDWTEEVFDNE